MKIVVTSHGALCKGILESYQMLAGKNDDIISIKLGNDDTEFKKELQTAYTEYKDEGIIFLCDIPGGTPFNETYKIYLKDSRHVRVVSGLNLAMLLEVGLDISTATDLDELTTKAIKAGKDSITLVTEIEESNSEINF